MKRVPREVDGAELCIGDFDAFGVLFRSSSGRTLSPALVIFAAKLDDRVVRSGLPRQLILMNEKGDARFCSTC